MDCKLRCEDKMHSRGESSWEFGELEKVRQCQHSGRCDENMCIYSGATHGVAPWEATCWRRLEPRHPWCVKDECLSAVYATSSPNCKAVWELSCSKGKRTHILYGLTNKWNVFSFCMSIFNITSTESLFKFGLPSNHSPFP